jgi:protein-S-isoprenylcysteine O-methyltransferase Ste14
MPIPDILFRFRRWVMVLIVALGFWAPWERMGGAHPGTTWLFLSGWLASTGFMSIAYSSIAVMAAAILCALLAALLRTWSAAYLGRGVVKDSALHGDRVVADGPYRYVQNPLYIGTCLNAVALAILMPPGGALFTIVAVAVLNAIKFRAEERFLTARSGPAYLEYAKRVPRFFPAITPRVSAGGVQAKWVDGLLGELYCWGVFVTYAIFAGRYNVTILEQGALISLGISVLVQGLWRPRVAAVS